MAGTSAASRSRSPSAACNDEPAGARAGARRRRAGRDARPARSIWSNQRAVASTRSRCSCSTKPTACSTWASSTTSSKIVAKLPKERQTLLFSATMPQEIAELARHYAAATRPRVAVTPQATTVERIAQRVIHDRHGGEARRCWSELLLQEKIDRVLVFTRTKHGADKVVRGLNKDGITAEAIHGNKSQNQRERVLAALPRRPHLRTLVATDIAARGIDVDGVSHVINFDLPNIPESYVHRIGRTARAGAEGIAISFCDHEERAYLRDIERLIRHDLSRQPTGAPAQRRSYGPATGRDPQWRPTAVSSNSAVAADGAVSAHGNGHRASTTAAMAAKAVQSQQWPPAASPAGRCGRGAKRHWKCYSSSSARASRAARRPPSAACSDQDTTGWRRRVAGVRRYRHRGSSGRQLPGEARQRA